MLAALLVVLLHIFEKNTDELPARDREFAIRRRADSREAWELSRGVRRGRPDGTRLTFRFRLILGKVQREEMGSGVRLIQLRLNPRRAHLSGFSDSAGVCDTSTVIALINAAGVRSYEPSRRSIRSAD